MKHMFLSTCNMDLQLLDVILSQLEVTTERRTYASTGDYRAMAVPLPNTKGNFDILVHTYPNEGELSAKTFGTVVYLTGRGRRYKAQMDRAGHLRYASVLSGEYELQAVGHPLEMPVGPKEDNESAHSYGTRCDNWLNGSTNDSLLAHTVRLLHSMQELQLLQLQSDTLESVGKLMETYKASSAALYMCDVRMASLRLFVNLNDASAPRTLAMHSRGIVPLVARSQMGYCADDVSQDPNYLKEDPRTKSEIAVPIRCDGVVIGVLNFESARRTSNFLSEHIADLEKQAMQLAPFLLLRQSYEPDNPAAVPLCFRSGDWGLSLILGPLCMEACTYFERKLKTRPSCTIWEYEEDKGRFHARVTSGFDYEYRMKEALPGKSFTGRMYQLVEDEVFSDAFDNLHDFLRRDKAEDSQLKRVVCSPIYFPDSGVKYGVISFYFFEDVGEVDRQDVLDFKRVVGSIIERFNRIAPKVIELYAQSMIVNSSVPSHAKFEVLRDLTQQILKSEYCSVFVANPARTRLRCVATSGLMHENMMVDIHKSCAIYDLSASTGLTAMVARRPGTALRKNESQDSEELVLEGKPGMPSNSLIEAFAFGKDDHRRILMASAEYQGQLLGVIRLNRSGVRAPYIKSDESALLAICRAAQDIMRNQLNSSITTAPMCPDPARGIVTAIASLLQMVPPQTTTLDSFLQQILFSGVLTPAVEPDKRHLHLFLRRVIRAGRELALDTFYALSTRKKQVTHDATVLESAGGLSWLCVEKSRPISFRNMNRRQLILPKHEFSADVLSGINMPFSVWNYATHQVERWVLSLEFEAECPNASEYIQVLLPVIRKVQQLLSAVPQMPYTLQSEQLLGFAERLKASLFDGRVAFEAVFNRHSGRPLVYCNKGRTRLPGERSSSETAAIDLMFASMRVGAVTLFDLPKVQVNELTNAVHQCWEMSGVLDSRLNSNWVCELGKPEESDEGVQYWANEAYWSGSMFDSASSANWRS